MDRLERLIEDGESIYEELRDLMPDELLTVPEQNRFISTYLKLALYHNNGTAISDLTNFFSTPPVYFPALLFQIPMISLDDLTRYFTFEEFDKPNIVTTSIAQLKDETLIYVLERIDDYSPFTLDEMNNYKNMVLAEEELEGFVNQYALEFFNDIQSRLSDWAVIPNWMINKYKVITVDYETSGSTMEAVTIKAVQRIYGSPSFIMTDEPFPLEDPVSNRSLLESIGYQVGIWSDAGISYYISDVSLEALIIRAQQIISNTIVLNTLSDIIESKKREGLDEAHRAAFVFLSRYARIEDKAMFQILGPVWSDATMDLSEDHPCTYYGGCRMFLCVHKEERDEPDDSILEVDPISVWFVGYCLQCLLRIRRPCHAIRVPLTTGGWRGCYCSKQCAIDSLIEGEQTEVLNLNSIVSQLDNIGIVERTYEKEFYIEDGNVEELIKPYRGTVLNLPELNKSRKISADILKMFAIDDEKLSKEEKDKWKTNIVSVEVPKLSGTEGVFLEGEREENVPEVLVEDVDPVLREPEIDWEAWAEVREREREAEEIDIFNYEEPELEDEEDTVLNSLEELNIEESPIEEETVEYYDFDVLDQFHSEIIQEPVVE